MYLFIYYRILLYFNTGIFKNTPDRRFIFNQIINASINNLNIFFCEQYIKMNN
jgi:hypothetical protein